jgi:nicotinate-nucleotide adenylyltransferase
MTEKPDISMRIGILGGSFNPIHQGHLIAAETARESFDLSQVIIVPCANPPHKSAAAMVSTSHRVNMIHSAVEADYNFEVSPIEIERGGTSYTIETITELKKRHPHAELYFIIGSDTLLELHLWKDIEKLLKLCKFITIARPGFDTASLTEADIKLDPPWPEQLLAHLSGGHLLNISSSNIRHRVAEGMSIRYLVPESVYMYITEHNLYRTAQG